MPIEGLKIIQLPENLSPPGTDYLLLWDVATGTTQIVKISNALAGTYQPLNATLETIATDGGVPFSMIQGTPTTIAGYGITDILVPVAMQSIMGYTGGGASNLDGISTTSKSVPLLTAMLHATLGWKVVRLRAGTDAAVPNVIIRPIDFNSSTNAKVWDVQN